MGPRTKAFRSYWAAEGRGVEGVPTEGEASTGNARGKSFSNTSIDFNALAQILQRKQMEHQRDAYKNQNDVIKKMRANSQRLSLNSTLFQDDDNVDDEEQEIDDTKLMVSLF